MTDLQTALKKALADKEIQSWSDDKDERANNARILRDPTTGKTQFGVSNNVMRVCFSHVKQNPGLTRQDHIAALMKQGFKESSLTSVLSQLVRTEQVRVGDERRLFVTRDDYAPMTTRLRADHPQRTRKSTQEKVTAETPRKKVVLVKKGGGNTHHSSVGIAALSAEGGEPAVEKFDLGKFTHHKPRAFHPSAIVDQLTVLHARELYDYLKKIFGGN